MSLQHELLPSILHDQHLAYPMNRVVMLWLYFAGSPFYHCIIDGSRATASGQGLNHVSTNRMAYFDVRTNGLTGADVTVNVVCQSNNII
jgi:uncharacterized protein YprB with RNaseH-like and TPR domain